MFEFKEYPKLITERLVLRAITLDDKEVVYFLRSDKTVNKYINRPPTSNLKDAEDFIQKINKGYENGANINWAIRLKESGEMIGSICLWNFSKDRERAETGYDLDFKHHNKGYMSEALNAVVKFGFNNLNLDIIDAYTNRLNTSSKQLLLKNGFVYNPTIKDEEDPGNDVFEIKNKV